MTDFDQRQPLIRYRQVRQVAITPVAMGSGAIISGTSGSPQAKVNALKAAGVLIAESTADIPGLVKQALGQ